MNGALPIEPDDSELRAEVQRLKEDNARLLRFCKELSEFYAEAMGKYLKLKKEKPDGQRNR